MRKIALTGLVVLVVAAFSSIGGSTGQRAPEALTSPVVRFVGLAHGPFLPLGGALSMSRFCNKEFPETRACELDEILRAIPPPDIGNLARVFMLTDAGPVVGCVQFDGSFVSPCGSEFPVACCGF